MDEVSMIAEELNLVWFFSYFLVIPDVLVNIENIWFGSYKIMLGLSVSNSFFFSFFFFVMGHKLIKKINML